jgi:hypothetical protein
MPEALDRYSDRCAKDGNRIVAGREKGLFKPKSRSIDRITGATGGFRERQPFLCQHLLED